MKNGVKWHTLNIVKPSMKSRSRSATVDGSGQGTSWQEYVCSFISLEALVFEKRKLSTATELTSLMLPPPPMTMSEVTPLAPAYLSSHDSRGHNSRKKKKTQNFSAS